MLFLGTLRLQETGQGQSTAVSELANLIFVKRRYFFFADLGQDIVNPPREFFVVRAFELEQIQGPDGGLVQSSPELLFLSHDAVDDRGALAGHDGLLPPILALDFCRPVKNPEDRFRRLAEEIKLRAQRRNRRVRN